MKGCLALFFSCSVNCSSVLLYGSLLGPSSSADCASWQWAQVSKTHIYVDSLWVILLIRKDNEVWYLNKIAEFSWQKHGKTCLIDIIHTKWQNYEPRAHHKLIFISSIRMPIFNGWALVYLSTSALIPGFSITKVLFHIFMKKTIDPKILDPWT